MTISKILITNNTDGNHSPDQWAMATAEILANISHLSGQNVVEGQRLVVKFADVLLKHFATMQKLEKKKLENDSKHILSDVELNGDLRKAVKDLEKTANGTPWEQHYKLPAVQEAMTSELRRLFLTSIHLDRMAHASKNPDCPHAAQYTAKVS